MSMTRASLISFALLAAALGFQPPAAVPTNPEFAGEDVAGSASVGGRGGYFRFNHVVGNGVGWDDGGYTTLGGWLPFTEMGNDNLWYADLRVFLTNDAIVGQNVGLGFRRYNADADRFFGFSVFYDHDHGAQRNGFGQITTSLETLGNNFDARVNGYFPVANATRTLSGMGESIDPNPFYQGNRIFFPGQGVFLEALQGGDVEVGTPLIRDAQWLRGYAGYYAYNSNSKDIQGFRGRLEAQLSDDLSVAGVVSDDRTFGTLVNLVVDIRMGGGRPIRSFPSLSSRERMYLPVQRNWRIATNSYKAPIKVVARDPDDNHKLGVVWVDNSAAPGGDGTYERPFQDLASAQGVADTDMVLVRNGTGAAYTGPFTLDDNQRLLGEGRAHQFDAVARFGKSSISGTFDLPEFTDDPSLYPTITAAAGNIINLGNLNNEVSAFNLLNAPGYAVAGSNITNFDLNHLVIDGAVLGGIRLDNAQGIGNISDSSIDNTFGPALQIANVNAAPLDLTITDMSSVSNNTSGLRVSANNSVINAGIDGYLSSFNQTGLDLSASNGGTIGMNIANSTFDDSISGDGMRITAVNPGSTVTVGMTDTSAARSFGNGLVVDSSDSARVAVDIRDGNFNDSGLDGVRVLADGSSVGNSLNMTDTTAASAGVDGLHVEITNASTFDINVFDGDFSGAGEDAVDTLVDGSSTLNLFIDPTPGTNAGANGYRFAALNNSVLNTTLLDMDLSNAGQNGVLGTIDNNSTANLVMGNSPVTNAGQNGMRITANNNSQFNGIVADGDFSSAGQNAIHLTFANGSDGTLNVSGSPATDSGQNGLLFDVQSGATLAMNFTDGDFSRSVVNAIQGSVDGLGSSVSLGLNDVDGNNSGLDGMLFKTSNAGSLQVAGVGGSYNNSGNHGIRGIMETGSSMTFNMDSFDVTNSGANGLYLGASGQSSFAATFNNGSFANSGLNIASPNRNAVEISADNSNGSLNMSDTAGNNSGQNGLFTRVQNGGQLASNIVNGNFNNSPGNAIQTSVSGAGSSQTINLTNTTGDNSGADGVRFVVSNQGALGITANGGSFNTSGDSGVNGTIDNGGQAQLNFTDVDVTNSNDDGLRVSSTNASSFIGSFTGSSFANSGLDAGSLNRNAINLSINGSTNVLNMTNTDANNAGADGLHFTVANGGTLNGSIAGGSFADAGSNAVDGFTTGNLTSVNLGLNGTSADDAGADGVLLQANSGSNLAFSFANSSISNAAGNGVSMSADGLGTVASLSLTNANVNGNGLNAFVPRDGVILNASSGATINMNMTQGSINGNRDNGIRAVAAGAGSTINMTGAGTAVNGNLRGDGLGFDVTSGARLTGIFEGGSFANNGVTTPGSGVDGRVNGLGSVATVSFNNTFVDNNTADGFTLSSLNSGSLTLSMLDGASASNNLGYGINFLVDGPNSVGNLLMSGNNIISNNRLGGIQFNASNGAQTTSVISGNVSNNGGAGVSILGNNLTINALTFTGLFSNNAGDGINVNLNNSTVNALTVRDATVTNNAGNGVQVIASNASVINNGLIQLNTISNNAGDGILFSLTNSNASLFSIDRNLAIDNNTGSGVHVVLNGSPTSDFGVTSNAGINGNGQNGVLFDLTNSDLTNVLIDSNAIQTNTLAGVQFNTTTSNVNGAITTNVISGNLLSGVGITSGGGPVGTTIDFGNLGLGHSISGNTISGNGTAGVGAGVLANVGENVNFIATLQDNTFAQNQSFGVGITSTDGSVDLTVGGVGATEGNSFDQNVGAGLALTLRDSATGTVDIQGNSITRTADGTGEFQGDGINIQLTSTNVLNPSTAQLTASVISNNVIGDSTNGALGNAGRGIVVTNDGNSLVNGLEIGTNIVSRNAGDGIQFNKRGDANITNVEVHDSQINDNGGDGLEVVVANGNQTTSFDIHDNQINRNAGSGVHLEVQADSKINANLTQNQINNNTQNGILVTEAISDPTDQRDVTGVWIQNEINGNGGHGINLSGAYGTTTALIIGQNGFDGFGVTLGNDIMNNGGAGISSNAIGTAVITNNNIVSNQAGGIDINSLVNLGNNTLTLDQNLIALNVGDGLELRATGTAFLSVTATGNSIVNNTGRGVDSLNQANATTFLQFGDGTVAGGNLISNNQGEGFYVVNTSSANQTQDVSASTLLLADGQLDVTPDMVLDLQFNEITNNGSPGAFSSAGLILRVGTSNSAGNNIYNNGTAGVGNAGLAGNGRVNARVTDNTFGGNFGSDVLVESFVSTIDPTTSAGTWDDLTFNVTQFQRDPLARLNMVFKNNVGEALDVTRGVSDRNAGNPNAGAFYANNEDTFKSRVVQPALFSDGPFLSGIRRRNAQRLASSSGPFAGPGFPGAAFGFAYDGVGDSTFRIESDFSTAGFTSGDTFQADLGAVPPVANAQGAPFSNPLTFGELPFGWDASVAPGTFQFLIP